MIIFSAQCPLQSINFELVNPIPPAAPGRLLAPEGASEFSSSFSVLSVPSVFEALGSGVADGSGVASEFSSLSVSISLPSSETVSVLKLSAAKVFSTGIDIRIERTMSIATNFLNFTIIPPFSQINSFLSNPTLLLIVQAL